MADFRTLPRHPPSVDSGLGVSERRVRKLARDGRLRGALKTGAEWLIPTPVEVIPGRRGPVGVAGRANESWS